MKKALLISFGIGILIVAVWFVLKSITNKVGKDINAFYHHDLPIKANKATATAIKALDFNNILNWQARNEPLYLETLEQLKIQYQWSEHTSIKADGHQETVTKSKALYEQEYQLTYLEIQSK